MLDTTSALTIAVIALAVALIALVYLIVAMGGVQLKRRWDGQLGSRVAEHNDSLQAFLASPQGGDRLNQLVGLETQLHVEILRMAFTQLNISGHEVEGMPTSWPEETKKAVVGEVAKKVFGTVNRMVGVGPKE